MSRQKTPASAGLVLAMGERRLPHGDMPVGSELIIAVILGLIGWWGIVHAVLWIAR